MIWADRIGVVLAILAGLFYWSDQKMDAGLVFGWLAIGPWLALRALDFVAFGRVRMPDSARPKQEIFPPGH
jgi:hypothetical protein